MTTKKIVNERVVGESFIPFIRSKLVYFKAEGLRPNSRVYAYFDDRDVSDWVRQQSTFVQYAAGEQDYGNKYNTATQYPFEGGPTTLTTDATGKIIGSFFIPNTNAIRFEVGAKEFKLLDVPPESGQSYKFGTEGALSRATTKYTAQGILQRVEQDVISYRTVYVKESEQTTRNTRSKKSSNSFSNYQVHANGTITRTNASSRSNADVFKDRKKAQRLAEAAVKYKSRFKGRQGRD